MYKKVQLLKAKKKDHSLVILNKLPMQVIWTKGVITICDLIILLIKRTHFVLSIGINKQHTLGRL